MKNDVGNDVEDLTGQTFTYLTVLGYAGRRAGRDVWNCRCKCGNESVPEGRQLMKGHTRSCGCYNLEQIPIRAKTHGMSQTSEYGIWNDIKKRCYNKKNWAYSMYGGRGIAVCNEWKNDFMAFYHDMGPRPGALTIDRIDNDGPYSKDNCKWATRLEQGNNKRNNVKFNYEGEILTIPEIARRVGVCASSLYNKYYDGEDMGVCDATPYFYENGEFKIYHKA